MKQKNIIRSVIRIVLGTALILLIPLFAMQFSNEVNWDLADFLVAGFLLASTALIYEITTWNIKKINHRVAIGIILLAVLLLIWADLAVGIFNIPGFSGS